MMLDNVAACCQMPIDVIIGDLVNTDEDCNDEEARVCEGEQKRGERGGMMGEILPWFTDRNFVGHSDAPRHDLDVEEDHSNQGEVEEMSAATAHILERNGSSALLLFAHKALFHFCDKAFHEPLALIFAAEHEEILAAFGDQALQLGARLLHYFISIPSECIERGHGD